MCARDIEVAKVGAIGFVDVEVAFGNWGMGGGNDGEKERESA